MGRRLFFSDPNVFIDLIASLPVLLFRAGSGFVFTVEGLEVQQHSFQYALLFGIVPVLRFLKILRHFTQFQLLLEAFGRAFEALPVLLFIYANLLMVNTVLVYIVEPYDNIPTLPQALWFVIVSASTTGYGDITPQSSPGAVIIATLIYSSMLYFAIPLGIIGSAFSEVWRSRHSILLTRQVRRRLLLWGYSADDIPKLFALFDEDHSGDLDFIEFSNMLVDMAIGLRSSSDHVRILFHMFDADGSGAINQEEFLKIIFPESYKELYGE